MRVAVGQYVMPPDTDQGALDAECHNARTAIAQAAAEGAGLVVLPEPAAPSGDALGQWDAQEFTRVVAEAAVRSRITVVAGLWDSGDAEMGGAPEPVADRRAHSAVRVVGPDGGLMAEYRKLHLYDAFATRESDYYAPGRHRPPVLRIPGSRLHLGVMTCYDLRFPEVARDLAVRGAHLVAVPAAWAAGPLKEEHWSVLLRARAVENTVYLATAGRTPPGHIGRSAVVDPLGVVLAAAGEEPAVTTTHASWERLEEARRRLPVLGQRRYRDPALREASGS